MYATNRVSIFLLFAVIFLYGKTATADIRCELQKDGEIFVYSGNNGGHLSLPWSEKCGDFPVEKVKSKKILQCERNPNGQNMQLIFEDNTWTEVMSGVAVGSLCEGKWKPGWTKFPDRTMIPGRTRGNAIPLPPPISIADISSITDTITGCRLDKNPNFAVIGTSRQQYGVKLDDHVVNICEKNGFPIRKQELVKPILPTPIPSPPPVVSPNPAHTPAPSVGCIKKLQHRVEMTPNGFIKSTHYPIQNQCQSCARVTVQHYQNGEPQYVLGGNQIDIPPNVTREWIATHTIAIGTFDLGILKVGPCN